MKINIGEIERLVKLQLSNGEAEALLEPLRELESQRRYGLVWEEPDGGAYEEEYAQQALLENFPFLTEASEQAIIKDENAPTNLLIEGDNLHALQALQYSHKGKVDVIYIDPPYNTGGKDFVYNDRYVDKEDSWRHSSWLSFMNKRLKLAKELMSEDGVIFLSIDDNEMAQLKLLCDQVFGEQNFVANLIWQNNKTGRQISKYFAETKEYLLVYKRGEFVLADEEVTDEKKLKQYKYKDSEGSYRRGDALFNNNSAFNIDTRPNLTYVIYYNEETKEILVSEEVKDNDLVIDYSKEDEGFTIIVPPIRMTNNKRGCWRWGVPKLLKEYKDLHFERNTKNVPMFYTKHYLDEGKAFKKPKDVFFFHGANGGKVLEDMLGKGVFSHPKPIDLLKFVIDRHTNKNAVVLDFFAGSGTTGHAVMALNEEDGGNRQFILCTNNEISDAIELEYLVGSGLVNKFTGRKSTNAHKEYLEEVKAFKASSVYQDLIEIDEYKQLGIARSITYERNKRVIEGYETRRGKEIEGLPNNLRYFTVDLKKDSNDDYFNAYKLIGDTIDIIRIKENLFNHQKSMTIEGIPVVRLSDKEKETLVVLKVDVTDEEVESVVHAFEDKDKQHIIYTSYKNYPYGNIEHKDLPEEILRALKMKEMN